MPFDLIHGRRADGQDVDWMLHVNPKLQKKGMLIAFNPLDEEVTRTIRVPLYYTGLTDTAAVRIQEGKPVTMKLSRDYKVDVKVTIPAQGMRWVLFEEVATP